MAVSKAYQELAALGLAVRLSEMADETGVVFVTEEDLAGRFGAKRQTIRAMVRHLEERGIVWKGRGKLVLRNDPVTGSKGPVKGSNGPVTGSNGPVNGHEHEEILDSENTKKHESLRISKENKKNTHAHPVAKPRRVAADDPGFRDFWASYPRRVGKVNASKWWEKHWPNDEELMSILHGLDMWTDHWQERGTELQFIPHPVTWLNAERWTEEPT